ncbi:MAG: hypothetical protein AAFX65_12040 [Cyanobacteria bacterium J06638_7]
MPTTSSSSKLWEIGFRGAAKVAPGWIVSPALQLIGRISKLVAANQQTFKGALISTLP